MNKGRARIKTIVERSRCRGGKNKLPITINLAVRV